MARGIFDATGSGCHGRGLWPASVFGERVGEPLELLSGEPRYAVSVRGSSCNRTGGPKLPPVAPGGTGVRFPPSQALLGNAFPRSSASHTCRLALVRNPDFTRSGASGKGITKQSLVTRENFLGPPPTPHPFSPRALVSTHRESEALISRWNHRIGWELGSVWMKIPENLGRWFLSLGVLGNMRVVDNITIPRQIQPKSRCVETNASRERGRG